MRKLIFLLYFSMFESAQAIPLQTWPDWVTTAPYVSKQVPPTALVARCAGLDLLCVMEVDQTTGAIPVSATVNVSINYEGPTGSPVPADAAFIGGEDPSGDLVGVAVDASGRLQIDGTADNDFAGPTGAPVPAEAGYMAGIDSGGDLQGISVDTAGQLQIDVVSSALPAGAATEAKQDSEISLLTTIDADTGTIAVDTTSIDSKTPALGQATMANSTPVVIASDQSPVDVDITTADVDIRDLDYTTDSVTAHQGGQWDITDITGTVSLPTGAATEAKQDTQISSLSNLEIYASAIATEVGEINADTPTLGQKNMAGSSPVVIASDQSPIAVTTTSTPLYTVINKVILNYASTNVTTAAYVEIVPSTSAAIYKMTSFEGSGQGMILATGASSSEVDLLYIPPGGIDGEITLNIPSGTRLSLKAITATANSGRFIANFMGL